MLADDTHSQNISGETLICHAVSLINAGFINPLGTFNGLTMGQILNILMLIVAIYLFYWVNKQDD